MKLKFNMFWKFNNNTSSEIDALLVKEDVTLQEVMDSEDIINQCKVQNKNLIDFLLKPEVIDELVSLTTQDPSVEIDERIRFKYPNIACELLTSDVPAINERLASDEALLDKLFNFLDCEPPLNPLLASFFSRIMGALIAKKTEQVLDFLKAKDTFISLLLKHLGTSAIMDLMLKLMTQVETLEMRQNILNWLDSQLIMQSLVGLLNSKTDKERHYNVAQLLCDFIRTARDTQKNSTERIDPDPLLNTLESSETVSVLLMNIFDGEKSESALVGGTQVLLALLDINQTSIPKINSQSTYNSNINDEAIDLEHKEKVALATTQSLSEHLKDFHDLLLDPPKKSPINTTVGMLNPPLGNTRLQVVRLIAAIISSNNAKLQQEIVALGTFPVLLDLFFKYPWNNFLHTQVENCLVSALKTHTAPSEEATGNETETNALSRHLLVNCNLIERILKSWKDNDEQQKESKGVRQGYMGHLISVTNKIVNLLCSNNSLNEFLTDELPEVAKSLEEFKDSTLKDTNAIQESLLGGAYPNMSNEDNDDYTDISFPQDQMYSNYQMQHLTSHCIDGYSGFNDDAFNDGDDTLQSIDHRTDMPYSLSECDLAQQHELFKQVCAQNINTLDDADDQIFEDRDHTFQTVIEKEEQAVYSSDSDDESASPPGVPMDVDPWSSPKTLDGSGIGDPLEAAADPWGSAVMASSSSLTVGGGGGGGGGGSGNASPSSSDWADFSSAKFEANFDDSSFEKPDGDEPPLKDLKCVVENDLKVESIEIEPKVVCEKPAKSEGGGANENVVAQENVAAKLIGKDSAAGDQGEKNVVVSEDSQPSNTPPKPAEVKSSPQDAAASEKV